MTDITAVQNFIGGEFHAVEEYLPSINPATGEVIGKIPDSGTSDVDRAVIAAQAAFAKWKDTSVTERSKYLLKLADLVDANADELAKLESRDQGKPVWLAKAIDIPRVSHNFRFFATCYLHHLDTANQMREAGAMNYTVQEPAGVAGLITPWNLPLYLLSFKIAPCLASGCVCICKPSEMTSLTAFRLCELAKEADLPPGVINMVFGTGPKVGDAIAAHPDIALVSFTGSTLVGEKIITRSAPSFKKVSLELGGKNAAIVFKDANFDSVLEKCVRSSFINQGEICLSTSRIFVEREIYEKFLEAFVNKAKLFRVGNPLSPETKVGALISKEHHEKVIKYINLARELKANILCGPEVPEEYLTEDMRNGYFVAPTVITDVDDSSALMQEEIFGPVTCVVPFDNEAEVIARANRVPYGLCASVYTTDLGTAHRVAGKLQVGTVWINTWLLRNLDMPFGGVKASGIGREGTQDSLHFFTNSKTICVQL